MERIRDTADQTVTVYLYDATTGLPYTTGAYDDAGIGLWYRRDATGAKTAITPATQTVTGAHSDGGFVVIDENAYRLDLPDAAFATGADVCEIGGAATAWTMIAFEVRLVDHDPSATIQDIDNEVDIIHDTVTSMGLAGAAANYPAESITVTAGTQTGTYANTEAADGTYHRIAEDGNVIDFYYQFDIGADAVPVNATAKGRVDEGSVPSGGDVVLWQAYDWIGADWETLGSGTGIANSDSDDDTLQTVALFAKHVGTGANEGKVRIRFYGAAMENNTEVYIDQIIVSGAVVINYAGINAECDTAIADAALATAANLATVDGIVDAILVDTSTTLDGKINTIDTIVDAILVDTGTTIPAEIEGVDTDVWTYSTRTLTQSPASVIASVMSSAITQYRGDTWSIEVTSLGTITNYANVWFTVKGSDSDTDANAIIQIDSDTGLLRLNAAAGTAAQGSITVDDDVAGDITIALAAAATAALTPRSGLVYDIQWQDENGAITTLADGTFNVSGDVTRTTS